MYSSENSDIPEIKSSLSLSLSIYIYIYIVTCYATEDAVRIVNSFITISHT
jgi:hypothetical protein